MRRCRKGNMKIMNKGITRLAAFTAAAALMGMIFTACSGGSTEDASSETTTVSQTETEAVTEAESISEEETADNETDAPASDNPLMPLVDAAMSAGEWPLLDEVTDEQIISDFFTMDRSKYEQSVFMQCPMSAKMCEIIIVKTDDTDSARADLEARQKKARETDAFYPADVERAGASIVGAQGNYAYFIMADDAAGAEAALVDAVKGLE